MNPRILLLAAAVLLARPARASADVIWIDPVWTVTPTVSGLSPPYGTGSATTSSVAANPLNSFLNAYAENPPGPGGPSVTARVLVSRSFRVLSTAELVSLEVPMTGSLSVGLAGGSSGATLTVRYDVAGAPDISIFRSFSAPATISQTAIDEAFLAVGDYTVRGTIELNAFALSGGPSASGNVTVGVVVVPTPQPVPEPGGVLLLASGAAVVLRSARRRRRKSE